MTLTETRVTTIKDWTPPGVPAGRTERPVGNERVARTTGGTAEEWGLLCHFQIAARPTFPSEAAQGLSTRPCDRPRHGAPCHPRGRTAHARPRSRARWCLRHEHSDQALPLAGLRLQVQDLLASDTPPRGHWAAPATFPSPRPAICRALCLDLGWRQHRPQGVLQAPALGARFRGARATC